jgi:phosphatidylinositol-3-phosphatase
MNLYNTIQKRTRVFIRNGMLLGSLFVLLLLFVPHLILAHSANVPNADNNSPALVNTASSTSNTSYQHIFLIMMENTGYHSLIGNPNAPWINAAAQTYASATNYYGVAHPSQPNYFAITSGSVQGVDSDSTVTVHAHNLVDQLEAHGKTWKAYMQSLFAHGNTNKLASSAGDYVRKHNPFASYADIQQKPARMANIVDFSQFSSDLTKKTLPNFVWISPDVCHDMHGHVTIMPNDPCGDGQGVIRLGDSFLHTTVDKITQSPAWTGNAAIFITWDESDTPFNDTSGCCTAKTGGGHVLTLVIAHGQHTPRSSSTPYNHYSLLATLEDNWQLGCLNVTCDTVHVRPMRDLLPF